MLNLHTKIKRNEEAFLVTGLGEEAVMMNLANGDFLGLNPVAADIWDILVEAHAVGELIQKLVEKYEVDEAQCAKDTVYYLEKMKQEKMLVEIKE